MRLSVQGCLILWLCLIVSPAYAVSGSGGGPTDIPDGWTEYYKFTGSCGAFAGCTESDIDQYRGYYETQLANCQNDHPEKECAGGWSVDGSAKRKHVAVYYRDIPTCSDGEEYNPDTLECEPIPQAPEECYENGEIYDAENQQCVTSCPEGSLNGVCLELPANNEENCNADSPDYQGFIGNGNTKMNLCESNRQCEGGAFGVVNGTPACIPDEYGPPTCDVSTVAVLDEYGFVCADPQDAPEPGQEPDEWWKDEEPNTDTDGDGEPDEYDPGNDPTSVDKGLDKINQGIAEGNKNSKGTNDRLDKIGKGVAKSNELQDEANGVANDTRNTVKEINEKLDGPDDGYNTEGLGEAPTFAESSERLQASIAGNPTIQAVTTIPSIASNNTCPVWTIPATDYWSAMPIDSHCTILNDHRGLLSMLFIAVWTLAAVFVFLRA